MLSHLCLLAILLHQVQCQDYLTCLRNNDAFSGLANQHTPSNNRGPIGYPGKKGVSGAKGDVGMKGSKGEVGETNRVAEERFRELQELITNHTRMILALQRQTLKLCSGDWYQASNGYLYKLTTTSQSWQESRDRCQEMGGDLAVVGMKDNNIRRTLNAALLQTQPNSLHYAWIGKSDIEQEGTWRWIDGSPVNSPSGLWHPNEPNGSVNENCGWLRRSDGWTNDAPCSHSLVAFCEKSVTNACG